MSDPDNLVLVMLRRLDGRFDDLKTDLIEDKERLGSLEQQYGSLSRRLDRISGDVDQIRRRLDLVDAP